MKELVWYPVVCHMLELQTTVADRESSLRTTIMLLLVYFAGIQASLGAPADSPEADLARLMRGEILVETIHEQKSGGAAKVSTVFHTSTDNFWNIVGYCKYEFVYVRGLEYCEVLGSDTSFLKKRHRVNNNWYTPTIDFTFYASRNSPEHGEFHLVEGNLKVMEGQWSFKKLDDSDALLVTHEIRVRSRFPAPRWLVRRVLKKDLPDMLACVRGLAEASGDKSLLANDLNRCPGDIPD